RGGDGFDMMRRNPRQLCCRLFHLLIIFDCDGQAAIGLSSAALRRKEPAMPFLASAADAAYALIRPLVHASDGEAAHDLTLAALQPLPRARRALTSPALATELAGLAFPNPVGLAPGFDKDARVAH